MSIDNLRALYRAADLDDVREGRLAYQRYHETMAAFASYYGMPLNRVIAAFCALSPNSDYMGNLRSLASVLQGWKIGDRVDNVTVSTYKHCRNRAWAYVSGAAEFVTKDRGPKILAFYHNILAPEDDRFVTVDGHMVAAHAGQRMTMKEAHIGRATYRAIAGDVRSLAFNLFMVPCELQATLWFARKRLANVKYDPQMDLFGAPGDKWRTLNSPEVIQPYTRKELA